jgi:2'-5' RNA ligase
VIAALPDNQQAFEGWYEPLVSVLAEEGFEPERRRFNAHITLARLRGRPRDGDLHELIEDAPGRADSLVMYQSLEGEYVPLFALDCIARSTPGRPG